MSYQLSICAETVYPELPFNKRVAKIAEAGFRVEFWKWREHDLSIFEDVNIQVSSFVGSGAGSMVHPDTSEEFIAETKKSFPVARQIGCRNMILLAGELGPKGEVIHRTEPNLITRWITTHKTLIEIAALAAENDVTFCLEHLNTKVDHPGYCINHVEDAARLVREVNSPNLKILMDLYHAQVEEGNVIQLLKDHHQIIGHIHVADVPGRHEPGTGEMNYERITEVLQDVGYTGDVGLEAFPAGDSDEAIERFREIFG